MCNSKQCKTNIGIVLPYLKSRGTEKQALQLTKGFIENGAQVILFVVQGWGIEGMYHAFEEAGARVINIGKPVSVGQKKVKFSRVFALAKLSKKNNCDVLFSRAGMTNRITGFAGLISSIPTIAVLSGAVLAKNCSINIIKGLYSSIRVGLKYGFPSKIVSVSVEGARNFAALYPKWAARVTSIHNGIKIQEENEIKSSTLVLDPNYFHLCYSGSIEIKRKGLDILIHAVKQVVFDMKRNNINLVLIGTGEDEESVKELVIQNNLVEHVIFAGEQEEPYEVMNQCQAFVLPSRREGLPNVLLEAMGIGLCSVASDCDTGPREIIDNMENGILVPVEDSKALAEAIVLIDSDDQLRNNLAKNGRKTVKEKFSLENMVNGYNDLVVRLVCKKSC